MRNMSQHMHHTSANKNCGDLCSPVRNRFYYGKLLDVFHFELEQNYFNSKRWLLNRLVNGYGVICGMNVELGPDQQSVVVTPGVAIDKCGHEIIVCQRSEPFPLPPPPAPAPTAAIPPTAGPKPPGGNAPGTPTTLPGAAPAAGGEQPAGNGECCDSGPYCHISICYHECPTDPAPAYGGDCDTEALCTPGAIRERYCLTRADGKLCPTYTRSSLQDIISGGLNYGALVNHVTNSPCPDASDDCCIPLANVRIPAAGQTYTQGNIDIAVRPIVYTNDMLYDLILAWMNQGQSPPRGGKY
jgi:hypothetical protein